MTAHSERRAAAPVVLPGATLGASIRLPAGKHRLQHGRGLAEPLTRSIHPTSSARSGADRRRRHEVLRARLPPKRTGVPIGARSSPPPTPFRSRCATCATRPTTRSARLLLADLDAGGAHSVRPSRRAARALHRVPRQVAAASLTLVCSAPHIAVDACGRSPSSGRERLAEYARRAAPRRPRHRASTTSTSPHGSDATLDDRTPSASEPRLVKKRSLAGSPPTSPRSRRTAFDRPTPSGDDDGAGFRFDGELSAGDPRARPRRARHRVHGAPRRLRGRLALLHGAGGHRPRQPDGLLRERPEFESIIGPFVNLLVLRLDLVGRADVRRAFGLATRPRCSTAHAHRQVPFEPVVERLEPRSL